MIKSCVTAYRQEIILKTLFRQLKKLVKTNLEVTVSPNFAKEMLEAGIKPNRKTLNKIYKQLKVVENHAPRPELLDNYLSDNLNISASKHELCGVIIESRKHPLLETVVLEFVERLNIPVQIFHGASAERFIVESKIGKLIDDGKVVLTPLLSDELPPYMYNTIVMHKRFWNNLIGNRKVLIFQTDTLLCQNSRYSIDDFMDFDYIGAKRPLMRPFGAIAPGGNGGLSLRDWTLSIECLNQYDAEKWIAAEDAFFGLHTALLGGNVGSEDDCAKFASQHEYLYDSFGAHNVRNMNKENIDKFLSYCPDAKRLL